MVQADTFVQQSDANKNYGTRSLLEVDNSPVQRTFIRILVSGVGGGQVTSARLRLQVAENDDSNSGGRIHHQPGCGWNETTLTWNNHNSFPFLTAVLDSEGSVNEGDLVEFNVTSVVPGDDTYCFVIDSLSSDGIDYNSREASSGKPTCVVQVSPATTTTTTPTTSTSTTSTSTSTSTTTTLLLTTTTSTTTTTTTTTSTTTTSTTSTTTTTTLLCIPEDGPCVLSSVCCSGACTAGTCQGTTIELVGAAGELQFPGDPLTTAEAQELSRKFAGEATLSLIYDPANTTPDMGSFHYVAPSGAPPAFEIKVSNSSGTSTYTFSEYRIFLDDTPHLDTLVFTPLLPADALVTLSTTTMVAVDIGLIWQDPTGTTLTSSSILPSALDFTKLEILGYNLIFLDPITGIGNGAVKGALHAP